jgi:hypothetical protein
MPMRRDYADTYRGWPVAPRTRQHPVRGSFLDPRAGVEGQVYHHGIDISVRDDRPESGAPPGRTHRVFALEGGPVWHMFRSRTRDEGVVWIGHFGYGHVEPVVELGQVVQPGQMIAWTTARQWHLHLSEWRFPGGDRERRVPVNPLDRAGKIAPFADASPPEIREVRFFSAETPAWRVGLGRAVFPAAGSPLDPQHLSGQVDVRAWIEDEPSFRGWFRDVPLLQTAHHPARVHLVVVRLEDGTRVVDRDVFRADVTLAAQGPRPVPISHHFAPGTRQNLRAKTALELGRPGRGELWFRLFARAESPYWDTTRLRNGPYRIRIRAWDVAGNRSDDAVDVAIEN